MFFPLTSRTVIHVYLILHENENFTLCLVWGHVQDVQNQTTYLSISKMIASMQRNLYGKVEELKKIKSFIYVAEVTV